MAVDPKNRRNAELQVNVGCSVIDSLGEDRIQLHVPLVLPAPPPPSDLRSSTLCTSVARLLRRRGCTHDVGLQPVLLANLGLDLGGDVLVLLQEVARVLASLSDALALVRVPGARLLEDAFLGGDVEQLALFRDALAVEDVELDLPEG